MNHNSPGHPRVWVDGEEWPVSRVDTRTAPGKATVVCLAFVPGRLVVDSSFPENLPQDSADPPPA